MDFAEKIGMTLAEVERTKQMAGAPDRVAAYLAPLYTSLVRDIMAEVRRLFREERESSRDMER